MVLARTSCCNRYFSSKEEGSEEDKEIWSTGPKTVPLAELEVRYTTTETKVYANLVMTVTMKTTLPMMIAIDEIRRVSKIVMT